MPSFRQKKAILLLSTACVFLYIFFACEFEFVKRLQNELYLKYFYFSIDLREEWTSNQVTFCDGQFIGYGNEFARLHHVAVNVQEPGNFFLDCARHKYPVYTFNELTTTNHLNKWMKSLTPMNTNIMRTTRLNTTFAVLRYEYANLFHQITDIYNVFAVAKILNINPRNVNILFFGRHKTGHVDKTWDTLFGHIERIEQYVQPVVYMDLIWAALGYNSPINFFSLIDLPYVEEFSRFFTSQHKVTRKAELDCDSISILFVWRHDYIAHPANPTGLIKRKIANEQEIIRSVETVFPSHYVAGVQLDQHDMMDQVQWISQTDILVGMHGAGLSHILFLPSHAGVLELFPNYWSKANRHFKSMAKWRKLHYLNWQNMDTTNENEKFYTYIPPTIVIQRLISLYYKMCHRKPASD